MGVQLPSPRGPGSHPPVLELSEEIGVMALPPALTQIPVSGRNRVEPLLV